MFRREQLQRHEAHELAVAGFATQAGGDRLATFADGGEALRLHHSPAHDRQNHRRHHANEEHIAPAITADEAIGPGAEKGAERAAGHHRPAILARWVSPRVSASRGMPTINSAPVPRPAMKR